MTNKEIFQEISIKIAQIIILLDRLKRNQGEDETITIIKEQLMVTNKFFNKRVNEEALGRNIKQKKS